MYTCSALFKITKVQTRRQIAKFCNKDLNLFRIISRNISCLLRFCLANKNKKYIKQQNYTVNILIAF